MKQILFDAGGGKVNRSGAAGNSANVQRNTANAKNKGTINMKLPDLSDDMVRTLETLLNNPKTKENAKGILQNLGWSEKQINAFVDLQTKKKSQGAKSTVNAKEIGGFIKIANPPKPKKTQPKNNITPDKYAGKEYGKDGDAEKYSGVNANDIHLKAKEIAMREAAHNLDDLRVVYRVGGGGANEADFKAYCKRNGIKYTPPESTKWLGN